MSVLVIMEAVDIHVIIPWAASLVPVMMDTYFTLIEEIVLVSF